MFDFIGFAMLSPEFQLIRFTFLGQVHAFLRVVIPVSAKIAHKDADNADSKDYNQISNHFDFDFTSAKLYRFNIKVKDVAENMSGVGHIRHVSGPLQVTLESVDIYTYTENPAHNDTSQAVKIVLEKSRDLPQLYKVAQKMINDEFNNLKETYKDVDWLGKSKNKNEYSAIALSDLTGLGMLASWSINDSDTEVTVSFSIDYDIEEVCCLLTKYKSRSNRVLATELIIIGD